MKIYKELKKTEMWNKKGKDGHIQGGRKKEAGKSVRKRRMERGNEVWKEWREMERGRGRGQGSEERERKGEGSRE